VQQNHIDTPTQNIDSTNPVTNPVKTRDGVFVRRGAGGGVHTQGRKSYVYH